ncbi:hypothetical protein [Streptomyces melanogenes]|uniref:hypothetical protein n=1 Tax=Streptomyces melanogenes TaxID=67326 RepID=UPI00167EA24B|nr:hypothetical protein [Streptomyces melanogenes]GGP80907.1 hypothetical protein GCM10010278_69330 [Streptomyces melanogenes]
MSEPKVTRTGEIVTASAVGRAVHVLAALLLALDEGSHHLSIVAERTNGTTVSAELSLSVGAAPLRVTHSATEYLRFLALVTFALEYCTVRHAVLVATTADEPAPRACGWTVRAGWLHPLGTRELREAAMPCPGVTAPRLVYRAPVLHHPDESTEDAHE